MAQIEVLAEGKPEAMSLYKNRWKALIVVLSATFMELIDISIVNVAIPSIQRDLGASYSAIQWVLAGYALAFALLLITGGRLGDIYGRKRLFLVGMTAFTLASVMCGVAAHPSVLITGRVLQGFGAGLMMPQVLSFIQVLFPAHERAKAFGAYGAVAGLATVSGPLAGALLTEADIFGLSWRPIFLVNVLVGGIAIAAAIRFLPESKAPQVLRLDFIGIALISTALLALFFPLIQGRELGWPLWGWVMMAVSVILLVLFVWFERVKGAKDGSPLVELRLFRERSFSAGVVIVSLLLGTVASFFLILTVSLQVGLGFSILATGLSGLPFSVGAAIGSGIGGKFAPIIGRKLLSVGVFLLGGGIVLLSVTVGHYAGELEPWHMIPAFLSAGLGLGLIIVPLSDFSLSRVERKDAGSASGITATFQQLGSAAGVALIGVIFFGVVASHAPTSAAGTVPQLRGDLVAAGQEVTVVNQLATSFEICFKDRSSEKDPNVVPPSCDPDGISPAVALAVGSAATDSLADNFAHAWQVTLLWLSGLVVVMFGLIFLLPEKAKHHQDLVA